MSIYCTNIKNRPSMLDKTVFLSIGERNLRHIIIVFDVSENPIINYCFLQENANETLRSFVIGG